MKSDLYVGETGNGKVYMRFLVTVWGENEPENLIVSASGKDNTEREKAIRKHFGERFCKLELV